uniref:Uncharacterized protein n=1 Tax=Physcomitrium patens TaxID=3218 RepID=A0A2K1JR10_PHYPA|nr:hypothetical protein PHYPA_016357 [Physcomitrium patens]
MRRGQKGALHRPGIEPGSVPWQGTILPLDHRCKDRRCRGSNPGHPRDRREYLPLYYNDCATEHPRRSPARLMCRRPLSQHSFSCLLLPFHLQPAPSTLITSTKVPPPGHPFALRSPRPPLHWKDTPRSISCAQSDPPSSKPQPIRSPEFQTPDTISTLQEQYIHTCPPPPKTESRHYDPCYLYLQGDSSHSAHHFITCYRGHICAFHLLVQPPFCLAPLSSLLQSPTNE